MADLRVLFVEEDPGIRGIVGEALRRESLHVEAVEAVGDCEQVLRRYLLDSEASEVDLLLLDVDHSKIDGFSFCRQLRAKTSVPIVMLSARSDETSIVVGLEVGADDYVTKPFNVRVLMSRVRAHLRRWRRNADTSQEEVMKFPGLKIDPLRHQVQANGGPVELSAVQFKILMLLASYPGRVYSREQIMAPIWGNGLSGGSRAADVHIQNIRQRIEKDPGNPYYLQTVRGSGYRFAEFGERRKHKSGAAV